MFHRLVSHNEDIKRLVDIGYAVAFDSSHLVIRDIFYLDSQGQLQRGAIVTKLVFENQEKVHQEDHQIFFAGFPPHKIDGTPIPNLGNRSNGCTLSPACSDVVVQWAFSNKPTCNSGKFVDFFEKIASYVAIISGPAMERYGAQASPYTFRAVTEITNESVFKFQDTLTSRAEITDLASKFKDDVIAIIGLGGTGAYLLDFLVKTPIKEIRAFDLDQFYIHNAFRSPGRVDESEFRKSKSEIYHSRYDNFRTGLIFTPKFFDASCAEDLDSVTFAFVCVDKGSFRAEIIDVLISKGIPFIDVGMGLNRKRTQLNGQLRTTYFSPEQAGNMRDNGVVPFVDNLDDEYKTNIQISELNALNACLAVIRFKQLREFYSEETPYSNLVFEIGDFKIFGQSDVDED